MVSVNICYYKKLNDLFYDNLGYSLSDQAFPVRFGLEHVEIHAGQLGFNIILEVIELRPLAVAIAHAVLLDSDFLEQSRRLLAGWRAEDSVVIAEMDDIAFLVMW